MKTTQKNFENRILGIYNKSGLSRRRFMSRMGMKLTGIGALMATLTNKAEGCGCGSCNAGCLAGCDGACNVNVCEEEEDVCREDNICKNNDYCPTKDTCLKSNICHINTCEKSDYCSTDSCNANSCHTENSCNYNSCSLDTCDTDICFSDDYCPGSANICYTMNLPCENSDNPGFTG